MIEKVKLWFQKTGLTNVGYLAAAAGSALVLHSQLLVGAFLGIFIYINFNVIQKLIKGVIDKNK